MTFMRRQLLLVVSAGLNVALITGLFLVSRHSPAPAPVLANVDTNGTNHRPLTITRRQFFVWQELESPDYRSYISNLHAIACPEQTIRDIIVADVNQLYARKRVTDVVTPDQQWWRSTPDTNTLLEASAKIQELDQERRELLTNLLGANWEITDPSARPYAVALNGPVLGDISPDNKDAVEQIVAKSHKRAQDYVDAQKAAGAPVDPAELAKIDHETRAELAQYMTPAQLQEYALRYSQTASDLRGMLAGVTLTPNEFRQLFVTADSLDKQLQAAGAEHGGTVDQQLQAAIQNVLGPDRYHTLQMAQDPAYRDAVLLGQQYGASPAVVQNLFQLNQATQDEIDRIRSDATLTPEEQTQQIQDAQQDQADARTQLLGLTPPPPPPAPPSLFHTFSPGETVIMIGAQYGVSPLSILNANPNLDFNNLQRGAPIRIPTQ